ncbi:Ketoreductase [Lachnellula suecica]|uniref:Ketoreductase n=1 Tax=Lachnellula suecica TaxID=602035 RepID=A0A8T9C5A3_9HELO|nr:Ketoreductase [Lachnellula suecica]
MASMNTTSGAGKTILVTGGSGFVAAEVLNAFLTRGYNVRTTVRNEASANKIKKSHSKYINQLSFAIVKDIQIPGGHDEAVKGVDGVIHTASPFVLQVEDNEPYLLKPAITGTTEVLASVQKYAPNVKRVVITSSFASIVDNSQGLRPGYIYSEKDWNPTTYEEAAKKETSGSVSYCASKTFAEKAAFEFVEKNKPNFAITTLCPPMVYGPSGSVITSLDHLNTSSAEIYRLMNGSSKEVPDTAVWGFVDVRDLGEAHARAFESPEAAGQRYQASSSGYSYQQVCDIIRKDFPEKKDLVPEGTPNAPLPDVYKLDNSKIKTELGMVFKPLEPIIHDMVAQFIEIEKATGKA